MVGSDGDGGQVLRVIGQGCGLEASVECCHARLKVDACRVLAYGCGLVGERHCGAAAACRYLGEVDLILVAVLAREIHLGGCGQILVVDLVGGIGGRLTHRGGIDVVHHLRGDGEGGVFVARLVEEVGPAAGDAHGIDDHLRAGLACRAALTQLHGLQTIGIGACVHTHIGNLGSCGRLLGFVGRVDPQLDDIVFCAFYQLVHEHHQVGLAQLILVGGRFQLRAAVARNLELEFSLAAGLGHQTSYLGVGFLVLHASCAGSDVGEKVHVVLGHRLHVDQSRCVDGAAGDGLVGKLHHHVLAAGGVAQAGCLARSCGLVACQGERGVDDLNGVGFLTAVPQPVALPVEIAHRIVKILGQVAVGLCVQGGAQAGQHDGDGASEAACRRVMFCCHE